MKTIGLLGGMSWESTILYYQYLNQGVRARCGGLHSARILLHSFDFAEIEELQVQGEWERAGTLLAQAARGLQNAGAELLVICTNLMHKVAPEVTAAVEVPLLHIADAAGREITAQNVSKVGLLGARYTMEEDFYRERLRERHAVEVVIPPPVDREYVHRVIFDELCQGRFTAEARAEYLRIIEGLRRQGAAGVVLGCTEIPLLVRQEDIDLPLFDTTALHARYALDAAFVS